jgi:hypothetical protein
LLTSLLGCGLKISLALRPRFRFAFRLCALFFLPFSGTDRCLLFQRRPRFLFVLSLSGRYRPSCCALCFACLGRM